MELNINDSFFIYNSDVPKEYRYKYYFSGSFKFKKYDITYGDLEINIKSSTIKYYDIELIGDRYGIKDRKTLISRTTVLLRVNKIWLEEFLSKTSKKYKRLINIKKVEDYGL
jgi:hypothetical protein